MVEAKVILVPNCADGGVKLATLWSAVDVRSVPSFNLPELRCLVNSNTTTNVDKLGLKANTSTKEGKDVGLRKLFTDAIFIVVDAVLVKAARGSPVGGYVP